MYTASRGGSCPIRGRSNRECCERTRERPSCFSYQRARLQRIGARGYTHSSMPKSANVSNANCSDRQRRSRRSRRGRFGTHSRSTRSCPCHNSGINLYLAKLSERARSLQLLAQMDARLGDVDIDRQSSIVNRRSVPPRSERGRSGSVCGEPSLGIRRSGTQALSNVARRKRCAVNPRLAALTAHCAA
jgi:hypothetical protein